MKRLAVLTILLLATCTSLHAQWALVSQSKPLSLGSGAGQVMKKVRANDQEADLNLVYFDSGFSTLQVLDQAAKNPVALDRRLSGTRAVAGCNGGYFTPEFQPLGLTITEGRRIGGFQKSDLLTAVIMTRKGRPLIVWRDEFADSKGITDLVQCGPRLIVDGKPAKGLKDSRPRARTFVLTDTAGHWAIGCCRYVTLPQLASILSSPKIIRELKVQRAVNLDGGNSSGLWWRDTSGTEHYDRESATVRNFLAVMPR
jgi:Phosphodiester glycosidase